MRGLKFNIFTHFGIIFFSFQFIWASVLKDEDKNFFRMTLTKNGVLIMYENEKQIGSIAPEIFTRGWEFHPIESSKNILKSKFEVGINGEKKVLLDINVKRLSGSVFRVEYTLMPERSVEVIQVRTNIFFPYDEWLGSNYQLGLSFGIIPEAPVVGNIISTAYDSSLVLGPSRIQKGLVIKLVPKDLYVGLQDSRIYGGKLYVIYTHGESPYRAFNWKAGEKKVFDFDVIFNSEPSSLSKVLLSLEPKKSQLISNTLSPIQLAWGETQLERLLNDRPVMTSYVHKGDDLWNWVVRQFAGEYVKNGIWWDARNPEPLWNAKSNEDMGKRASIQITSNFYSNNYFHWGEPKTSCVLWFELFYEMFNLQNLNLRYELMDMAKQGKVTKEEYIIRILLIENQSLRSVHNFFHNIWIPHCRTLSLPYEDKFLIELHGEGIKVLTDEEVYKKYFHPELFRYKYYSEEYDRLKK